MADGLFRRASEGGDLWCEKGAVSQGIRMRGCCRGLVGNPDDTKFGESLKGQCEPQEIQAGVHNAVLVQEFLAVSDSLEGSDRRGHVDEELGNEVGVLAVGDGAEHLQTVPLKDDVCASEALSED